MGGFHRGSTRALRPCLGVQVGDSRRGGEGKGGRWEEVA